MTNYKPKKGGGAKGSRPKQRSGASHASCSEKRRRIKERLKIIETELRILGVLHDSFVQEVRDMMQGPERVIPDREQL